MLDLLASMCPFSLNISQPLQFSKHDSGYLKDEDELNTVHELKQLTVKGEKEIHICYFAYSVLSSALWMHTGYPGTTEKLSEEPAGSGSHS